MDTPAVSRSLLLISIITLLKEPVVVGWPSRKEQPGERFRLQNFRVPVAQREECAVGAA
jgi:hypothetical protein